jgi:hypothetical protein
MTDAASVPPQPEAPPPSAGLGTTRPRVVDLIRVPELVQRAVRETPMLARVFVALAIADVFARTLGLLGPPVDLSLSRPLSVTASFLPRDLLIVLPAIIMLRLRNAYAVTPWVVAGAIVVAVAEILGQPLASLVQADFTGYTLVTLMAPAGWAVIGWGLGQMNPKEPSLRVAGTANLVAALVVLASLVVALLPLVVTPAVGFGQAPPIDTAVEIGLLQVLGSCGWAYLFRAVIRGFEDPRRPDWATSAGAIAAALSAVVGLVIAVVTVLGRIDPRTLGWLTQSDVFVPLVWLGAGGALSLLVVAFGLGLADPYRRVGGMRLD